MSECAQIFSNNVAYALGGQVMQTKYIDLIEPKNRVESAEDIITRISEGLEELGEEDERI